MGPARGAAPRQRGSILTFEHLITGPVIHIVYWCGLGVIVVAAFGIVGASVGIAIRDKSWQTWLLAGAALIPGILTLLAGGLIWRAFCEFFVAIFRISDDLAALRRVAESEQQQPQARAPQPRPMAEVQPAPRMNEASTRFNPQP